MPLEELTFTVEGVTVRLTPELRQSVSYTGAQPSHWLVPAVVEYVVEGRAREEVRKTDYFVYDSEQSRFISSITKYLPFSFFHDRSKVERFDSELLKMGEIYSVLLQHGHIQQIIEDFNPSR